MAHTSTRRRSSASMMRSRKTMANLLALMAMMLPRGAAFLAPGQPCTHQALISHEMSTQLSARRLHRRQSQTAAFYSSTADPPLTDKAGTRSFGNRMRNLVLRQQQDERKHKRKQSKKSLHNPSKPSFVEEAVSLNTYKELVADEKERLVVVRFYAKWCRACKAVEPHFYRLAHSMPDVKFVEVPVLEENANLHQGLGVPALPFAHVYSPTAGLVEELRMSKKEFKNFQRVVETYRDGQCSDLEVDAETKIFSSPFDHEEKVERQQS